MLVKESLQMQGLVTDETRLVIRADCGVLSVGRWCADEILDYGDEEIASFTWRGDNDTVFVTLRELVE